MTYQKREDGVPAFSIEHAGEYGFMADDMTLREYAAIHLRVPNSGKAWLDEMIEEANWDRLAAHAINGIISCEHKFEKPDRTGTADCISDMVKVASFFADKMLAERRKRKG